jgi:hypothetical protein
VKRAGERTRQESEKIGNQKMTENRMIRKQKLQEFFRRTWEKKFSASYTVEASYVMAIVLLSLSVLIRTAYGRYQEETAVMRLHHVVEQLRGQEGEEENGRTFGPSSGGWSGQVKRNSGKVQGSLEGEICSKEIEEQIHEPENMMRKVSIWKK